ncbi:MAG: oligosaccharide flippase family protein [Clostridium sp.]
MMKTLIKDKRIIDLAYTLGGNVIALLTGIILTFIIPKILPMDEYGYFRIFTFYLGYVGLFHLGFNDGIYMNYGKYDYDTLPKEKFRTYFKFLWIFQGGLAIIVMAIGMLLIKNPMRQLICVFLAINIFVLNLTCYFEFISQCVREFKVYSRNMVLSKVLFILLVIPLILLDYANAIYLIGFQTIVNITILVINIIKYRQINFVYKKLLISIKDDIKSNISLGFFIMIGNFVSIIIIGVDRIFIDKFFTIEDFAMYSFAVSLLSMVYILLNGIRTVVYPYLARSNEKNQGKTYETMKTVVFILLGYCLATYFVFKGIVGSFLPDYIDALSITAIIFPTIILSGEINIVSSNFYKTLKLEKYYTKNNLYAVAISLITILIAFLLFRTKEAIATSSLISFYLWGLYGDKFFRKHIGAVTLKHHIAEIITIGLFLYLAFNYKWYISMVIYIIGFTAIVVAIFLPNIKELRDTLMKRS